MIVPPRFFHSAATSYWVETVLIIVFRGVYVIEIRLLPLRSRLNPHVCDGFMLASRTVPRVATSPFIPTELQLTVICIKLGLLPIIKLILVDPFIYCGINWALRSSRLLISKLRLSGSTLGVLH